MGFHIFSFLCLYSTLKSPRKFSIYTMITSNYCFFKEHNLVYIQFQGEVNYSTIKDLLDKMISDPNYSEYYVGIADFRYSDLDLSTKEINLLTDFLYSKKFTKGRRAILVDKPKDTALALLYRGKADAIHPCNVYSTLGAAMNFLNIDERELKINPVKEFYSSAV